MRLYLRDLLAGLSYQWHEADRLIHVADTVWWDTPLASAHDAAVFKFLVAGARWNAWKAESATKLAAQVRRRYRTAFRYVPVNGDAGRGQASGAADRSSG